MLSQFLYQFQQKHQCLPTEIVIHPVALAALAIKQSVAPKWQGIPVKCQEIEPGAESTGNRMGVTVVEGALRAFDL